MKHDHANIEDIQMDLFTKSTKEVHANVEKTWQNYPGPRAAMIAWGILSCNSWRKLDDSPRSSWNPELNASCWVASCVVLPSIWIFHDPLIYVQYIFIHTISFSYWDNRTWITHYFHTYIFPHYMNINRTSIFLGQKIENGSTNHTSHSFPLS